MDCCTPQNISNNVSNVCTECGREVKVVQTITLYQMLKRQFISEIKNTTYFYCDNSDCNVVYFSNETGQHFSPNQVRIAVGSKQPCVNRQLCYCFDYTEKDIIEEIERTGMSTAAEDITAKVQAKLCACEIRNPAGRCCLGQVRAAIKTALDNHSLPV